MKNTRIARKNSKTGITTILFLKAFLFSLCSSELFADLSEKDLEIYHFMKSRWYYYESKDGSYNPSIHDPLVLSEASEKYGRSTQELDSIIWEMAKRETGHK